MPATSTRGCGRRCRRASRSTPRTRLTSRCCNATCARRSSSRSLDAVGAVVAGADLAALDLRATAIAHAEWDTPRNRHREPDARARPSTARTAGPADRRPRAVRGGGRDRGGLRDGPGGTRHQRDDYRLRRALRARPLLRRATRPTSRSGWLGAATWKPSRPSRSSRSTCGPRPSPPSSSGTTGRPGGGSGRGRWRTSDEHKRLEAATAYCG